MKSSDTLLSNFMFKSLKQSLDFCPSDVCEFSLKIFIFGIWKCWGKRQDPRQFEGTLYTPPSTLPGSVNKMNLLPECHRCFHSLYLDLVSSPLAQPRGARPPFSTVPRAPSSSPTPFLCCPLQPNQTLPSYLNITKAPAHTLKLQVTGPTTPWPSFYIPYSSPCWSLFFCLFWISLFFCTISSCDYITSWFS